MRRALQESMKTAGLEQQLEEEERILAQVLQLSAQEADSAAGGTNADEREGFTEAHSSAHSGNTGMSREASRGGGAMACGPESSAESEQEIEDNSLEDAVSDVMGDREESQHVGGVVDIAQPVA